MKSWGIPISKRQGKERKGSKEIKKEWSERGAEPGEVPKEGRA